MCDTKGRLNEEIPDLVVEIAVNKKDYHERMNEYSAFMEGKRQFARARLRKRRLKMMKEHMEQT